MIGGIVGTIAYWWIKVRGPRVKAAKEAAEAAERESGNAPKPPKPPSKLVVKATAIKAVVESLLKRFDAIRKVKLVIG